MAVFVSVTTDAFEENFAKRKSEGRTPLTNIRRPLRGIQVKRDTYSVLRVMTAAGTDIPLLDSSSDQHVGGIGQSTYYANYLIQSVAEQRVEKQQIIETFGEDYVYFFGEQPRFLNVSGCLINTSDFNWKSEFWANYENNLRGTRLVEQNARAYFYFDDVVVEGYFVSASAGQTSDNPHMLSFNFQLFVSNYAILSSVGSVFPTVVDDLHGNAAGSLVKVPPDNRAAQQQAANNASRMGSSGGLNGFLAAASQFAQNADFAIQETLENLKTFFYGKRLVVPDGLDSQIALEPITSQASFPAPPGGTADDRGRYPYSWNADEYVERGSGVTYGLSNDRLEEERVEALLKIQSPEDLDRAARASLAAAGVNIEKPSEVMILVGRGAFAALQYTAPMGLGLTGGRLGVVDQGVSTVL